MRTPSRPQYDKNRKNLRMLLVQQREKNFEHD